MKKTLKEFLQEVNPYGIPYSSMIKGKKVVVDIPIGHEEWMEVEGTITTDIWRDSPNCFFSQIKLEKQNTHKDTHLFSKGLYAVYPEKIKRIYERIERI